MSLVASIRLWVLEKVRRTECEEYIIHEMLQNEKRIYNIMYACEREHKYYICDWFSCFCAGLEGDGAGAVCFCGDVNFGDIFW